MDAQPDIDPSDPIGDDISATPPPVGADPLAAFDALPVVDGHVDVDAARQVLVDALSSDVLRERVDQVIELTDQRDDLARQLDEFTARAEQIRSELADAINAAGLALEAVVAGTAEPAPPAMPGFSAEHPPPAAPDATSVSAALAAGGGWVAAADLPSVDD